MSGEGGRRWDHCGRGGGCGSRGEEERRALADKDRTKSKAGREQSKRVDTREQSEGGSRWLCHVPARTRLW
jgi:hypothetical protein